MAGALVHGELGFAQKAPGASLTAAAAAMREGSAAVERNDLGEARRDFSRAVALTPQVSASHGALGFVMFAQGDFAVAQRELVEAHRLAPGDASTMVNLARTDVALAEYVEAAKLFHEALGTVPPVTLSAEEALDAATAYSLTGEVEAAKAQVQAALVRTPGSAALEDGLGVLVAQTGQVEEAIPHFERAVALDAGLAKAQLHLGAAWMALNQAERAIGPLEAAAQAMLRNFDAYLQLGQALSATHQDVLALKALHRASELRAEAPAGSQYALGLALQASGDAAGALRPFADALRLEKSLPAAELGSALTNAALAKVQTGDAAGAVPLYARALALGPDSPVLREDYGVAFLQQADLDHAIAQFRAGLSLEPESAHLHYDLGLALKLKDDLGGAVPEFERAAALDPELPDPAYTLGVIYMQQGRYPEAATQLRRATVLQPSNGEAWAVLGGVLKDAGDAVGAVESLRRAIVLEPDQPSLHIQLAALMVQAGRAADAAAERKVAADLSRAAVSQQRASFALRSGRTLLAEGKLPEAAVQLATASQADPHLSEPHRLLAEVLSRQGKAVEAANERRLAASLEHP